MGSKALEEAVSGEISGKSFCQFCKNMKLWHNRVCRCLRSRDARPKWKKLPYENAFVLKKTPRWFTSSRGAQTPLGKGGLRRKNFGEIFMLSYSFWCNLLSIELQEPRPFMFKHCDYRNKSQDHRFLVDHSRCLQNSLTVCRIHSFWRLINIQHTANSDYPF